MRYQQLQRENNKTDRQRFEYNDDDEHIHNVCIIILLTKSIYGVCRSG